MKPHPRKRSKRKPDFSGYMSGSEDDQEEQEIDHVAVSAKGRQKKPASKFLESEEEELEEELAKDSLASKALNKPERKNAGEVGITEFSSPGAEEKVANTEASTSENDNTKPTLGIKSRETIEKNMEVINIMSGFLNENKFSAAALEVLGRNNQDDQQCFCSELEGRCEDQSCRNRKERRECVLGRCGEECSNMEVQRLRQKRSSALVVEEDSREIVATRTLAAGVCLGEWTGEVVTKQELWASWLEGWLAGRLEGRRYDDKVLHVMELKEGLFVDATDQGSMFRQASHSCSPSARTEVWQVQGRPCLVIRTTRHLAPGQSVTLDFGPQLLALGVSKQCSCKADGCRLFLGASLTSTCISCCCLCSAPLSPGLVDLHPSLALPCCSSCRGALLSVSEDFALAPSACLCCGGETDTLSCTADSCTAAFCRPCLERLLGQKYLPLATSPSWRCLLCDSRPLLPLKLKLLSRGSGRGRGRPRQRGGRTGEGLTSAVAYTYRPVRGSETPRIGFVRGVQRPRFPGGHGLRRVLQLSGPKMLATTPNIEAYQPQPFLLSSRADDGLQGVGPRRALQPPTRLRLPGPRILATTPHRHRPFLLTSPPSYSPNTSMIVHPPTPMVDLSSDEEEEEVRRPPKLPNSITFTRVGTEAKLLQEMEEVNKLLVKTVERVKMERKERGEENREGDRRKVIRQAVKEAKQMIELLHDKLRA